MPSAHASLAGCITLAAAPFALGQSCELFQELPLLPGTVNAEAAHTSRDGRFVVGSAALPGRAGKPFIWTADGGLVEIPWGEGVTSAFASHISDDGTVVFGSCTANARIKAFRWTAAGGMQVIEGLGAICDISADGSVAAGYLSVAGVKHGYRWTAAGGLVPLQGDLWGTVGIAGITPDGSMIGGNVTGGDNKLIASWDAAGVVHTTTVGLPTVMTGMADDGVHWVGNSNLPPDAVSAGGFWAWGDVYADYFMNASPNEAHAISADGAYAVGSSTVSSAAQACRWNVHKEVELAPNSELPSAATEVNADGSVAVGYLTKPDGTRRAFVWTHRTLADFNRDGFVDFFDYDDFVGCFETAACPPGTDADFNRDGFVDFFDYDDFVAAFENGC